MVNEHTHPIYLFISKQERRPMTAVMHTCRSVYTTWVSKKHHHVWWLSLSRPFFAVHWPSMAILTGRVPSHPEVRPRSISNDEIQGKHLNDFSPPRLRSSLRTFDYDERPADTRTGVRARYSQEKLADGVPCCGFLACRVRWNGRAARRTPENGSTGSGTEK